MYKKLKAFKIGKKNIQWRKTGGVGNPRKNLLAGGQTALATVQNVQSGHGIHQNLRETYTLLMVPC